MGMQHATASMVAKTKTPGDKAKKAAKSMGVGEATKKNTKVYYKPVFHRPKTLRLLRNPKYSRRSVPRVNKLDSYQILKFPLTTESARRRSRTTTRWSSLLTR